MLFKCAHIVVEVIIHGQLTGAWISGSLMHFPHHNVEILVCVSPLLINHLSITSQSYIRVALILKLILKSQHRNANAIIFMRNMALFKILAD